MSRPDPSAWGVYESYQDHRGQMHRASSATIEHILEAMGAQSPRPATANVRVITEGEGLQSDTAGAIEVEDGGGEEMPAGRLPPDLPLGYHRLIHGDGSASSLIVSPGACFLPAAARTWGWAVQLYSARSAQSWGIGDLYDLAELGRWARSVGAGALLINPLAAPSPGVPQQPSPYFPSSRIFHNPLYLRIEDVPGGAELTEISARGRALNSDGSVDRDAIYRAKMEALEALWRTFQGSARFDDYVTKHSDLLSDFATHAALAEALGPNRFECPAALQRHNSREVADWARERQSRVDFHRWLQWLLDEQLGRASREITLIHDLPVGVDPAGADAWIWQDSFTEGIEVGAPPDELSTAGQAWGLAPFDPWKLRAAEYEPFIQTVRAALRHGSGLRIDHVMGLFRLYWIPRGMSSADGTYVRYPARDLLNILALESHRAGAFIVGEDLGTVEAEVREEMARRSMLSYRVMWFEDGPPRSYPPLALATVTNHDLPTIAGVWTGADLEEQQRVLTSPNTSGTEAMRRRLSELLGCDGDVPFEAVIEAAYRLLAESPSMVVMATLEDALGLRLRPNIPGTTSQRPNWSLALPVTIEEIGNQDLVARIARVLSDRRPPADPAC